MGKNNQVNLNKKFTKTYNMRIIKKRLLKKIGKCEKCGYNDFIEVLQVAHIKHGNEDWKINSKNLLLLCPTCHVAFDFGLIDVNGIISESVKSKGIAKKSRNNIHNQRNWVFEKKNVNFVWEKLKSGKWKPKMVVKVEKFNC